MEHGKLQMNFLFKKIDVNGTNRVDRFEFMSFLEITSPGASTSAAQVMDKIKPSLLLS